MTTAQDTYLAARIEDAQDYLAWLKDMYHGLQDGTYLWSDWNDEITCIDRQEAAIDQCWMAISGAIGDLAMLQAQAKAAPRGAGDGET